MNEALAEQLLTEREEEINRLREALKLIVERSDSGKNLSDSTFRAWAASYAECVLEGKETK